ncbi:unnamed protein product [Prorocentrum cordatum]|uniref:Secreted protein n=1 Tax=Prorocentrum cordatum TaxID=2364126 RepID=A0ABN9TFH8_9DINO|nr:unnamed protein product [Polarella glacialis]
MKAMICRRMLCASMAVVPRAPAARTVISKAMASSPVMNAPEDDSLRKVESGPRDQSFHFNDSASTRRHSGELRKKATTITAKSRMRAMVNIQARPVSWPTLTAQAVAPTLTTLHTILLNVPSAGAIRFMDCWYFCKHVNQMKNGVPGRRRIRYVTAGSTMSSLKLQNLKMGPAEASNPHSGSEAAENTISERISHCWHSTMSDLP